MNSYNYLWLGHACVKYIRHNIIRPCREKFARILLFTSTMHFQVLMMIIFFYWNKHQLNDKELDNMILD